MNNSYFIYKPLKHIVFTIIFLLTGCSYSFDDSGQSLGSNDGNAVALGDVDADGDLDIAVANQNQGNRVYINNGSGRFSDSGLSLGTNSSQSIALGDVDGHRIVSYAPCYCP